MKFVDTFTSLCNDRGESPSAVCKRLGLSNSAYSFWKQSGSVPRDTTLHKIADYFEVPVSRLKGEVPGLKSVRNAVQDGYLTSQERAILSLFRNTTDEGRLKMMTAMIVIKSEMEEKGEK